MASLQEIVEQLVLVAATNGTTSNGTSTSSQRNPFDLITSVLKMLLSTSALRHWAILLAIGSLFEMARRSLTALWNTLIDAFFITAIFEDNDDSFERARNVEVSTANFNLRTIQIGPDEDWSGHARKVTYVPVVSDSYHFWYNYRWISVTRAIESQNGGRYERETLTMRIMTRNRQALTEILQEAMKSHTETNKDSITIYISGRYSSNDWTELATSCKRPLKSIILDPGITDLVVGDVRDFLGSKDWYSERGIPFRRGYLLYGAPGSGKTSLIHSIAGELGLDVYIMSLSRPGLDDTGLSELIAALPERCIALMEDIDAAFHHGLNRESPPTEPNHSEHPDTQPDPPEPSTNRVSLSGLLNALDGIGAQEGRVLFATTNKYGSLDPALCRPGRMDLHIEFKLASRFQAEELFKRFYAPSSTSVRPTEKKHTTTSGHIDAGVDAGEDTSAGDLIDLSDSPSQTQTPAGNTSSSSSPPSSPPSLSEKLEETVNVNGSAASGPTYTGIVHQGRAPILSRDRINVLAAQFVQAVPERRLSMTTLQGFLMMYKTRPFAAVAAVAAWVEKELSVKKEEGRVI